MAGFIPYADAEVSGFENVKSMKMQTSGKAFFVIIAKIYSYKERSMIREICCNAADIHKISNQTKPFDVYLPNELSPVFIVRDYGTGLSEDGMALFTTVFESSKEGSENETGYYGLGSKSPFAYTSSFNVVSYFNGTMSMYTVFLDGSKEPKYVKTAECSSTEENGLEIQIPVEDSDFRKFEREAQDVLSSFTVPYNLHGTEKKERYHFFEELQDSSYREAKFHFIRETENAYCLITSKEKRYSSSIKSEWYAQLGDVIYPIDKSQIRGELPSHFGVMKFKPKDLDIPPSRETLEYTPRTLEAIKNKCIEVSAEINEFFSSELGVPNNPSDVRAYGALKLGKDTFWSCCSKHKSYFSNTKYDFSNGSNSGFSYYTKVDINSKDNKIWIYDTARSAEIFRQYCLKHSFTAVNVITLNAKKTSKIIYAKAYEEKFKQLKDALTANGYTVFLASELEASLKLDAPVKRCFMYKMNNKGIFCPLLYSELQENPKFLVFNSTDSTTESIVSRVHTLNLYPAIKEFSIIKIQPSKFESTIKKLQDKFKNSEFFDKDTFNEYIEKSQILLDKLSLKERLFLAIKNGDHSIPGYHSIDAIVNEPLFGFHREIVTNLAVLKEVSNIRNSSFYDRLNVDQVDLKNNLMQNGINLALIQKICDLTFFIDYCRFDEAQFSDNTLRKRQCNFNRELFQRELTPLLTKKEEPND